MELAESEGRHAASMSTEDRLRAIISDFHEFPGLATKNMMDEDKVKSILNLIGGSCPDPGIQRECIWSNLFGRKPKNILKPTTLKLDW